MFNNLEPSKSLRYYSKDDQSSQSKTSTGKMPKKPNNKNLKQNKNETKPLLHQESSRYYKQVKESRAGWDREGGKGSERYTTEKEKPTTFYDRKPSSSPVLGRQEAEKLVILLIKEAPKIYSEARRNVLIAVCDSDGRIEDDPNLSLVITRASLHLHYRPQQCYS